MPSLRRKAQRGTMFAAHPSEMSTIVEEYLDNLVMPFRDRCLQCTPICPADKIDVFFFFKEPPDDPQKPALTGVVKTSCGCREQPICGPRIGAGALVSMLVQIRPSQKRMLSL